MNQCSAYTTPRDAERPVSRIITKRPSGATSYPHRVGDRELPLPLQPGSQGLPAHVWHDVEELSVRGAAVEQREDVGVLEARGGLDLAQEPLTAQRGGQLGMEDLDGDRTVVAEVVGQIHGGHATSPELALDAVTVGKSSCKLGEPIHVYQKATLPRGPGLGGIQAPVAKQNRPRDQGYRTGGPYRPGGIRRPGVYGAPAASRSASRRARSRSIRVVSSRRTDSKPRAAISRSRRIVVVGIWRDCQ